MRRLLHSVKGIRVGVLPPGYTQIEYSTNASSTKINTGIMIDKTKNYEFEIRTRAVSGSYYLIQSRDVSSGSIVGISGSMNGNFISLTNNGSIARSTITRTIGNILYIKASFVNGVGTLYVKDETANVEDTATGTYTELVENTTPLYLWGNNVNTIFSDANVYYCCIKANGQKIIEYIPAKNSNDEVGFYDTVSESFVGATTGTIIAGPEV